MNLTTIFRILGILLMIFSLSMFPPILIDFWYKEFVWIPFLVAFALTLGTGFILWLPFRHQRQPLKTRDGLKSVQEIIVVKIMVQNLAEFCLVIFTKYGSKQPILLYGSLIKKHLSGNFGINRTIIITTIKDIINKTEILIFLDIIN